MHANIPDSIFLGNSKNHFGSFAQSSEKIELYGSTEAALNNALEVAFAEGAAKSLQCASCPFEFQERGPGLVADSSVIFVSRTAQLRSHRKIFVISMPELP